jgi:DNA-directed RNA polymerase subunit RPC12/RpoP
VRHPALSPQQIIAEFQRRRRVASKIQNWVGGLGFGSIVLGILLVNTLPGTASFWVYSPIVLAMVFCVFGAFYAPHLYRCPSCARRVREPDPTDSGYRLIKDPAVCPHCGVVLK